MLRLLVLSCFLIATAVGSNQFVDLYLAKEGQDLLPVPEQFGSDFHHDRRSDTDLYADRAYNMNANDYPQPAGGGRTACGLQDSRLEDASFCDPDSKLTLDQRVSLNNKIKDAVAAQYCHCTPCTNAPRANGRFSINIAIAGFLFNSTDSNLPYSCVETKAPMFANSLKTRWAAHEKCQEGVWVAYSTADRYIDTQVSSRARNRLSTSCISTINEKLKQYLDREEHFNLLDNLVDYYKHALRGGKCGEKSGLTQDQVIAITCGIIFGVGGLIFIIMLCVGFFRNWSCIKETCLGLIVGAILRAIQIAINILIIKCMNALCNKISSIIPACEEPCACCKCEPLTCVEDAEAGGGGGGGW